MAAPKAHPALSPVRGGASQGEATGIPTQGAVSVRWLSVISGKGPQLKPAKTRKGVCAENGQGPCIRCSNNATLLSGRFPNHLGADTPTARADIPMQHTLSQELPESPGPTSHWLEWVSDSWGALAWNYRLKSSPCHPTWAPKGKQHCPGRCHAHSTSESGGEGATMRSLGLGEGLCSPQGAHGMSERQVRASQGHL